MDFRPYRSYSSAANARVDLIRRITNACYQRLSPDETKDQVFILMFFWLIAAVNIDRVIIKLRSLAQQTPLGDYQDLEWLLVCLSATVDIPLERRALYVKVVKSYIKTGRCIPAVSLAKMLITFPEEPWKLIQQFADKYSPKATKQV